MIGAQLTAAQRGSFAVSVLSLSSAVMSDKIVGDFAQQTYWQVAVCSCSAGLVLCQITGSTQFIEGSSEPELQARLEGDL